MNKGDHLAKRLALGLMYVLAPGLRCAYFVDEECVCVCVEGVNLFRGVVSHRLPSSLGTTVLLYSKR